MGCHLWGRTESDTTEVTQQQQHQEVWASQMALVVRNLTANPRDTRDMGSIPGSGRSPGGGNGNLLQYSCLENSMERGASQAPQVHGIAKDLDTTRDGACMHASRSIQARVVFISSEPSWDKISWVQKIALNHSSHRQKV